MGRLSQRGAGSRDDEIEALSILANGINTSLVGMTTYFPPTSKDGSVDPSWIECGGQTIARAAAPALWERVKQLNVVVSDTAWLAIQASSPNGAVSVYSSGDGSTSMRMPTTGEDGGFMRAVGTDPVLNALHDFKKGFQDQIQNIAGEIGTVYIHAPLGSKGALKLTPYGNTPAKIGSIGVDSGGNYTVEIDASLTVRSGEETHPKGMYGKLYVYAGNVTTRLPTPTLDWLAQQNANTAKIAELESQTPFAYGRGGNDVNFTAVKKFYFSEVISSDVTYNSVTRDFTINTAGYYKVFHACLGVKDANKKRFILTKNKQTAPDRFVSSDYFAQGYCDPTGEDHSPITAQGVVRCEAGDTIQSWAMSGGFYLGLGSDSSDFFNQLTIEKI